MPLFYTDGIINRLNSSKSSRELEKNYRTLSLFYTNKITNRISPSKSFKKLKKITSLCLEIQITDAIINITKFHWKILGGSQENLVLITDKNTNRL